MNQKIYIYKIYIYNIYKIYIYNIYIYIYKDDALNSPLGSMVWTYTYPVQSQITLNMTKKLEDLFKHKNISKETILKKFDKVFIKQKNIEVEKIRKEYEQQMKIKGHYILMKCKTCGKIYEHTEFFDSCDRFREKHNLSGISFF